MIPAGLRPATPAADNPRIGLDCGAAQETSMGYDPTGAATNLPGNESATLFDFRPEPDAVAAVIARLGEDDAASLPLLTPEDCGRLCAAARGLSYRPGQPVIGQGETAVRQDFDVALDFPAGSLFHGFSAALDRLLAQAIEGLQPPLLEEVPDFRLNDLIVQRYPRGSFGITPHRDHLRYHGLVAVVTLCGAAPFFVCADRQGSAAREVPAPPGHLLLMRAPGYAGAGGRPFHYLGGVTEARISLGLRYDSLRPGPSGGGEAR